jgi:endonuclease/exonuclease/phosphatase (EEP) superfamily protein YafD
MAVLIPGTLVLRRRRLLYPLLIALIVLLGPVMRLCLPWRALLSTASVPAARFRIVTCNADEMHLDAAAMGAFVREVRPDVVIFQGWRSRHEQQVFQGPGGNDEWHFRRDGELFLASRFPILGAEVNDEPSMTQGDGALAHYELLTPAGRVHVFNLHLATPRQGLEAIAARDADAPDFIERNTTLRRRQSQLASRWAGGMSGPVLVAGDFNTPPDSPVYRQYWSSYTNAFSFGGFGFGNTHFTRRTAIRIDHVLAGEGWRVSRCWVGPNVGSAHRPVVADLELRAGFDRPATTSAP